MNVIDKVHCIKFDPEPTDGLGEILYFDQSVMADLPITAIQTASVVLMYVEGGLKVMKDRSGTLPKLLTIEKYPQYFL